MTLPAYSDIGVGSETSAAWPTHSTGHFGILAVEHGNDSASIATPSGWTPIPGGLISSGATNCTLTLFYRFATSGAMANAAVDFNGGGTQNHKWGVIITYTGVNTSTPIHSQTSAIWGPATTAVLFPGLQTLLDDCMIVHFGAIANDDAGPLGGSQTNAGLGSVSERYDGGTATGNGGSLYIFDGTLAAHTRIEPSSVTFSTTVLVSQMVLALCAADKQLPTLGRKSRVVNTGSM